MDRELSNFDLESVYGGGSAGAKGVTCGVACATCELCKIQNLPDNARPNRSKGRRAKSSEAPKQSSKASKQKQ